MELEDFDIDIENNDFDFDINEDIGDDIIDENEAIDIIETKERTKKITAPVMTIYEKIDILTQRVNQLNNGYKTTVPDQVRANNLTKSIDISILEFDLKKLPPFKTIRKFPDGTYEVWKMSEFEEFP